MQLPTHVIFGVLIQLLLFQIYPKIDFFFLLTVFVLAFISHFILDSLAIMTYHPPERQHTNFWLCWHIFVYSSGILYIIILLTNNPILVVGILGANLTDIWDWILLRWLLKSQNKKLYIHKYAIMLRSFFKDHVPDLTYKKIGIIPEFLLIIVTSVFLVGYFL